MSAEHLKLVAYCPLCETRSNPVDARLLGTDGDTQLMHVTCRKCGSACLSLVLVSRVGASSVGLVTDLTYDDVMRFRRAQTVGIDDVIETHAFLEGDAWKQFARAIKKPRIRAKNVTRPKKG